MTAGKKARADAVKVIKEKATVDGLAGIAEKDLAAATKKFKAAFSAVEEKVVRDLILNGKRIDGRSNRDLRQISCEVGLLPRAHGSSLFTRGETQALVTITLGTSSDEQRVDGLADEYSKKFMLDYNFPPFSVGEKRGSRSVAGPPRNRLHGGPGGAQRRRRSSRSPDRISTRSASFLDILESSGSSFDGVGLRRDAGSDGRRRADPAIRWSASRSGSSG